MTKASVISLVPVELFTQGCLKKAFGALIYKSFIQEDNTGTNDANREKEIQKIIENSVDINDAFNILRDEGFIQEDKTNPDIQQAEGIQKTIEKNVDLENEFCVHYIKQQENDIEIKKINGKIQIKKEENESDEQECEIETYKLNQKIFLAIQGTGMVFIVVSELLDKEKCQNTELITDLIDIREYMIKSLVELDDDDHDNILREYLNITKKTLRKYLNITDDLSTESQKKLCCPAYVFSYYSISNYQNDINNDIAFETDNVASLLKLEEREEVKEKEGPEEKEQWNWDNTKKIQLANGSCLYANYSTLCQLFSKDEENQSEKFIDLIALEIIIQLFWNRADRFSKLIYEMTRNELDIENAENLYYEFLTAITNVEFITSSQSSAATLELFDILVKTSSLENKNTKLQNRLEMLKYRDTQNKDDLERKHQNSVQLILGALTFFTIIAGVFDLRWIDLNSWGLGVALIIFLIIFIALMIRSIIFSRARSKAN